MNILQGKHFFLKLIEVFLSALVLCGTVYFGVIALSDREDFKALYLLVVGALALRASTELLRPRSSAA